MKISSCDVTSFGDRFRKDGTEGGGWVHPKGANSMAASGLNFRNTLVGTGWAISLDICTNGLRKQLSHLVGPPFEGFSQSGRAVVGREP